MNLYLIPMTNEVFPTRQCNDYNDFYKGLGSFNFCSFVDKLNGFDLCVKQELPL